MYLFRLHFWCYENIVLVFFLLQIFKAPEINSFEVYNEGNTLSFGGYLNILEKANMIAFYICKYPQSIGFGHFNQIYYSKFSE